VLPKDSYVETMTGLRGVSQRPIPRKGSGSINQLTYGAKTYQKQF